MGLLDGLNACRRRAVNEVGLLFDAAAQYLGERDLCAADAEKWRQFSGTAQAERDAALARAEAAEAEAKRLRARVAELEERARLIRNQVANEADERWAMAKETENGQACLLRGWSTMMYDLRRQLDDLLAATAPEEPEAAPCPHCGERVVISRHDCGGPAPEEPEAAPGTAEWAASAPLDEVRAWLDGRGRRSVAHYLDVGWEANLWGDRGTRIARARAETEEAALRALAAQVAGGEGDA